MSESGTNLKIEDVLSSIRRLVTEEGRPNPAPGPVEGSPQVNRLVLTPALRVADTDHSGGAASIALDTHIDPEGIGESADDTAANQTEEPAPEPAEDGAASQDFAQDETPEPESADPDAPWVNPAATLFHAARSGDVVEQDPHTASAEQSQSPAPLELAPEWAQPADHEGEEPSAEPDRNADETISETESLPPIDGVDMDVVDEIRFETSRVASVMAETQAKPEAIDEDDAEQSDRDAEDQDVGAYAFIRSGRSEQHSVRAASLSAKIAALEATIAETKDQWEPDGEVGDDYAGTRVDAIAWQDHDPKPQTPPTPETQPDTAEAETETVGAVAADESFLDEESLRELVADIVREELQGALGERITRNVRKLVRREIHRALTVQELD
jgi:hypothetical protein